jgi:hypothetical protein
VNWRDRFRRQSVTGLTRFACILTLIALAMMSYSIVSPRPLPVILAMSVGHAIGVAAFVCYLLAVVLDTARSDQTAKAQTPGSDR